jgi:hypothetical protein
MKNGSRKLVVVLITLGLFFYTRGANAKDIAGVITSVSGTWFVDGVKVREGQRLTVGTIITAKEPNAKYSRIVVKLLDLTEKTRTCDRKGFCGGPLRLPDVVTPETSARSRADQQPLGFWERFVIAINRSKQPEYRKTLTRGGSNLQDQVVRFTKGGVDLTPVFIGQDDREFILNIEPVKDQPGRASRRVVEGLALSWKVQGQAIIKAPTLTPGLYKIVFSEPEGVKDAVLPPDVWVLVVESSNYQRIAAEYAKARESTAGWDRKIEPRNSDFLRAFLEALVSEEGR